MIEPFKFMHNGKEYTSYDPLEVMSRKVAAWTRPSEEATQIVPDDHAPTVLDVPVSTKQETPQMEAQTETEVKAPKSKKVKSKGAGPTAFSQYCKEHKIDGVKARRALRAEGLRAPYDPKSKKVLDILKAL